MIGTLIVFLVIGLLVFLWLARRRRVGRRYYPFRARVPRNLKPISVQVGGSQRVAYIPPSQAEARMQPLLLCFHGGLGNLNHLVRENELAELARRRGFLAVFPWAPDGWVDGRPERGSSTQDLDFVVALVERLTADKMIDPARVYALGVSNGGMFVQHLATQRPGVLAGAASVIASLPAAAAEDTSKGRPVPFVLACDRADSIMPFQGGMIAKGRGLGVGGRVVPVEEARAIWVRRNKAGWASAPRHIDGPSGFWVNIYDHPAGEGGAPVRFVEVQGAGHRWTRWPAFKGTAGFNIGDVVLDFFAGLPERQIAAGRSDDRLRQKRWGTGS